MVSLSLFALMVASICWELWSNPAFRKGEWKSQVALTIILSAFALLMEWLHLWCCDLTFANEPKLLLELLQMLPFLLISLVFGWSFLYVIYKGIEALNREQ